MVLLLTNKKDVHPTSVLTYLREQGFPVFRLNTECLLTDYKIEWHSTRDKTGFYIQNVITGLSVSEQEVSAVWDRRPTAPEILPTQNERDSINQYALEEAKYFLEYLKIYVKDKYSIGSSVYDRTASSKLLQNRVAIELGVRVPDTLFSNDKQAILRFAATHPFLAVKSLGGDTVTVEEGHYIVYTKKVALSDLVTIPEDAFLQTVNYVQEYIEKDYEMRITVVNNDVFACKILSQEKEADEGQIDWRQGYDYGITFLKSEAPFAIESFCKKYLAKMELHFGCFDFIVDKEGDFWFLECNPNGQWLWIEEETGMKISRSIAMSLIHRINLQIP